MIAIPNMEKPKGCRWCPLNHDSMCYVIQPYKTDETNGEQRRTDCPLIEIVRCGECIWKEECTITELWGGRGFCPSGERRAEQSQINTIENTNEIQSKGEADE